jgi:hypothetical protein
MAQRAVAWTNPSTEAQSVGPEWGTSSSTPLVREALPGLTTSFRPLATMELLKYRGQEVILEIFGELDGPVVGFGHD